MKRRNDALAITIVDIVKDAGGTLLLDHILIRLYKTTGTIHKRKAMIAKLFRMQRQGLIFRSPLGRGVYTTTLPSVSNSKR